MTQTTRNPAITGMSDDSFFGREPAPGVDLEACRRAAVREARRAYNHAVMQSGRRGALMLRRAVYRLAIVLGNQSDAQTYLYSAAMPALTNVIHEDELADERELARGVQREYRHPQLVEALHEVEGELDRL